MAVIAALSPNNKFTNLTNADALIGAFIRRRHAIGEGLDLSQDETKDLGHLGDVLTTAQSDAKGTNHVLFYGYHGRIQRDH